MSTYLTLEGCLKFPNQIAFDTAVKELSTEGWIENGVFVDECGDPMTDPPQPATDPQNFEIHFPYSIYRNIGYWLDQHYPNTTGRAVWTCTDGCFSGGIIQDGKETTFDLDEWGRENVGPPEEAELGEGEDEGDRQINWHTEVEQAFNDEFASDISTPPTASIVQAYAACEQIVDKLCDLTTQLKTLDPKVVERTKDWASRILGAAQKPNQPST